MSDIKIVVADDSITARMVTKQCLGVAGFSEATFLDAADGAIALQLVKEHHPDLLVTDLVMPNLDGTGLLKAVKADPTISETRVIIITSAGNSAKDEELLEEGAEAIIAKPVSPAKLVAALADDDEDEQGGGW
jgi:two-component system chemotaxis response regulator CheY